MNVVDSSAWLEYLSDGPNAAFVSGAIEDPSTLLVPSVTLSDVFRHRLQLRSENHALQAVALMRQGQVVDLGGGLAVAAAKIGLEKKLPLADSVILATARRFEATLWTMDADFEGMPNVKYRAPR